MLLIHIRCKKCGGLAKLEETVRIRGVWYRFYVCARGHVLVVKDNGRKAGKDAEPLSPEQQLEAMREVNRILQDQQDQAEEGEGGDRHA